MKKILLCGSVFTLLSCGSDPAEQQAQQMLSQARFSLSQAQYTAAKDTILSMRKRFPTAIAARRQGILLLDSVEMLAAADSLQYADSTEWERLDVKHRFFQRKLEEDLKKDRE